jgi:hypothetical protein
LGRMMVLLRKTGADLERWIEEFDDHGVGLSECRHGVMESWTAMELQ